MQYILELTPAERREMDNALRAYRNELRRREASFSDYRLAAMMGKRADVLEQAMQALDDMEVAP